MNIYIYVSMNNYIYKKILPFHNLLNIYRYLPSHIHLSILIYRSLSVYISMCNIIEVHIFIYFNIEMFLIYLLQSATIN
jgi:hypothetical protein